MNILFYYPDKERAISLSSLMIAFKKQGHTVSLLTQSEAGDLHRDVSKEGVSVFCHPVKKNSSFLFFWKHIRFLAWFTKKHKIDLVYSHIQRANLVSCIAQFFSPSRFIFCRHHSDSAYVDDNRRERMADRIINRLAKEFIVPSQKVFDQMIETEKVKNRKIHLIRYAYNFDDYRKPDPEAVKNIRKEHPASSLLIKVARLIPEKRHLLLFGVVKKLVQRGFDIKLLVLSDGPLKKELEEYIFKNGLQNHIFMIGYRTDVINFLAAADLVVHVSESEASSSLAKEAGLVLKPLIVCRGVGDFDEYLVDGKNSILIPRSGFENELEDILNRVYKGEKDISLMGKELHQTILDRFSIQNIIKQYDIFHGKSGK